MSKSKTSAKASGLAVKRSTRTNISVDGRLAARVKKLSKAKTTSDAVHVALDHYARSHDYKKVLALYGSGGVAEGYDPKTAYASR